MSTLTRFLIPSKQPWTYILTNNANNLVGYKLEYIYSKCISIYISIIIKESTMNLGEGMREFRGGTGKIMWSIYAQRYEKIF